MRYILTPLRGNGAAHEHLRRKNRSRTHKNLCQRMFVLTKDALTVRTKNLRNCYRREKSSSS